MSSDSKRAVWLSNTDNKYSDGFTGPVIAPKIPTPYFGTTTSTPTESLRTTRKRNKTLNATPWKSPNSVGINRLPPSILRIIFLIVVKDDVITRTLLLSVCEFWRTLALGLSEMWAHIYVDGEHPGLFDAGFMGIMRARSALVRQREREAKAEQLKETLAAHLKTLVVSPEDGSGPMEISNEEDMDGNHPPPQAGPIRNKLRPYRVNSIDENLEAEVSWTDLETTVPLHIHLISPTRSQLSTLLYRARTTRWKSLYITLGRTELSEGIIEELFLGKDFPILETLHIDEIVRTEWLNDLNRNETVTGRDNYWEDDFNGTNTSHGQPRTPWPHPNNEISPTFYNQGQPRTPWPTSKVASDEPWNRPTNTFDSPPRPTGLNETVLAKNKAPDDAFEDLWEEIEYPQVASRSEQPTKEITPTFPATRHISDEPRYPSDSRKNNPRKTSDKTALPKTGEPDDPLGGFWKEMEENKAQSRRKDLFDPSNSEWFDSRYDTQRPAFAATNPQHDTITWTGPPSIRNPIGPMEAMRSANSMPLAQPLGLPTDPYAPLYDAIAISATKLNDVYVDADVTGVAQMYGLFGQQVRSLGGASSYIRNAIPQHDTNTAYSHIRELRLYSWDSSLEPLLACLPQLRYLDVEHYPDAAYIDTAMLVSTSKNGALAGSHTILLPSVTDVRLTNHSAALLSRICASGLTSLTIQEYDGSCDGCLPHNYRGKGRISHFFLDKWSCANIETAVFSIRVDITSLLTFLAPAFALRSLTVMTPNPDLFDSTAADIYLDWKMQFVTAMSQFDTSSGTRSNPGGMLRYCPHLESLSLVIPGPYTDDEWGREANKIYEQRGRTKYMRSFLLKFHSDGRQEMSGPAGDLTVIEGYANFYNP